MTQHRQPARSLQEEADMRAQDLKGLEVIEGDPSALRTFANEYGRVRTDRVIQPTGMPPAEWALCDQVNRADPIFPRGEFR